MDFDDIKNFSVEQYLELQQQLLLENGFIIQTKWDKDKTYNKDDVVQEFSTNILYDYVSLQDDNLNNPLTDTAFWQKTDIAERIISYNTLSFQLNMTKEILLPLIRRFFDKNKYNSYLMLISLLCSCYLYSIFKIKTLGGIINSQSIADLSESKSYSQFIVENPVFNNPFGLLFYDLYKILFRSSNKIYGVKYNNPYGW